MKPAKLNLDEYCECPNGRHVRRFLPQPENLAEMHLIDVYDVFYRWPDRADLIEAIERFTRDGATAENLEWARHAEERFFERQEGS